MSKAVKFFYDQRVQTIMTSTFMFIVANATTRCVFPVIRSEIEMPQEYVDLLEQ